MFKFSRSNKRILLVLVLFLFVAQGALAAAEENSCRSSAGGYCVNLSAVAQAQGTSKTLDFLGNPQTIGVLVANLYYFGLGIVAVAAFIMMVIGGFTYMTAGDNPGRVKEGTDFIKNALFGLLIALISWLILYTINPDLVKSLDLAIPKIELRRATPPTGCPPSATGGMWWCPFDGNLQQCRFSSRDSCNASCSRPACATAG